MFKKSSRRIKGRDSGEDQKSGGGEHPEAGSRRREEKGSSITGDRGKAPIFGLEKKTRKDDKDPKEGGPRREVMNA